jgi:hypothetical protein
MKGLYSGTPFPASQKVGRVEMIENIINEYI